MTTREKVMAIIDAMSDAELEVEYRHLVAATRTRPTEAEFEASLARVDAIRAQVKGPVDAVALVREGRDELAERGPLSDECRRL